MPSASKRTTRPAPVPQPPRYQGSLLFSTSIIDDQTSPCTLLLSSALDLPPSTDKRTGTKYNDNNNTTSAAGGGGVTATAAANEKSKSGNPNYIGSKKRIFQKDMPGKWKKFLMGFTDWYERDDEFGGEVQCVVWPREEYVRMWITCDEGLYMQRFGGVLDRVERILEGLGKRQTRSVRTGAAQKKVDDMLEYAVRLATGARVLKDEVAAFRMLTCVAKGPYSRDKIALADNMLCYLYKKRFSRDAILENLLTALVFGDFASSNGPFTHCILTLASFFAPFRDIDPYKGFTSLWEKFDDYRERWGLMVPGQKCCSVCGAAPKKMKGLKRCAGSCLIPRKPLYCGKSCQKKHWLTHRKWCSKAFTLTESDLESDQYYTDCDDFDSEDDGDSEYYNSGTDEVDGDDSEDWEDDDGNEAEDSDEGSAGSIPGACSSEDGNGKGKYYSTSGESSADASPSARPRKFKNKRTIWTKKLTPKKRKKTFWNDDGDFDFDGFVMDIARSIVRLRNT